MEKVLGEGNANSPGGGGGGDTENTSPTTAASTEQIELLCNDQVRLFLSLTIFIIINILLIGAGSFHGFTDG